MPDARVYHRAGDGAERILAREVEFADGPLARARGLMFRRSVPDDYALVFRFDGQRERGLHMLFVPFPLDAVWIANGVVQRVARLRPWIGWGRGIADTIVELPAGAAADVEPGDRVVVD